MAGLKENSLRIFRCLWLSDEGSSDKVELLFVQDHDDDDDDDDDGHGHGHE